MLKRWTTFLLGVTALICILAVPGRCDDDGGHDNDREGETVALSIGRSIEWKIPSRLRVSVSNGSIVHVTDLGAELKVTGKKLGSAQIRAGTRILEVFVLSPSQQNLFERLKRIIKARRGLELGVDGKEINVRGRLLRFEDWLDLAHAAEGSGATYTFAATMTPELQRKGETFFRGVLRESHLPELAIGFQPCANVSLPAEPSDLRTHVERSLSAYGFRLDTNAEALGLEPMIRVRLIVAEFKKSMMRQIGIKWPSTINAQLLPTFQLPTESQLSLDISALEESGMGKILASPTLLCRSGKDASFLAGGEFPIKILNYKAQDIVWKQYGVRLNIHPKADFSGRMSIGIETEVSMLDTANAVDGIPGLLTNRIESHFDLARSRTIVLSGLIKKELGESSSGLPGLASLPILGPLFGSHDYRDNRTELVVFVTPELVKTEEAEL